MSKPNSRERELEFIEGCMENNLSKEELLVLYDHLERKKNDNNTKKASETITLIQQSILRLSHTK